MYQFLGRTPLPLAPKKKSLDLFFYMLATHNDQSSFVRHALGPICVLCTLGGIYVFFTLLGYWLCGCGGGVSQWNYRQPTHVAFHP